jgi:hypothetical protein
MASPAAREPARCQIEKSAACTWGNTIAAAVIKSAVGELQPGKVADDACHDGHVRILRNPVLGCLVGGLCVTFGVPRAHRDRVVAFQDDAVGDEAGCLFEDR